MKYIKTTQANGTMEVFIFPRSVDHDKMATMLASERGSGVWVFRRPVSAGFYSPISGCHGESDTLGMASDMDIDTRLVERQMSEAE